MKGSFVAKLQNLGRRAEQIRQAVETAPEKAARLREAVTLTASQLQQVRAEVQTGIAQLRADTGDRLLASLAEIRDAAGVLSEAGFELTGVDLELGLAVGQRLLLQLRKIAEVPPSTVEALALAHPQLPVLGSVLVAIQRALELGKRVDLRDLEVHQLIVSVGPVPSVRIGWRSVAAEAEPAEKKSLAESGSVKPVVTRPEAPAPSTFATPPVLGSITSVLFPPTPAPTTASTTPLPSTIVPVSAPLSPSTATVPSAPPLAPLAVSASAPNPAVSDALPASPPPAPSSVSSIAAKSLAANWRAGALDRFKTMPNLAKR